MKPRWSRIAVTAVALMLGGCSDRPARLSLLNPLVAELIPNLSFQDSAATAPARLLRPEHTPYYGYYSPLADSSSGFTAVLVDFAATGIPAPNAPILGIILFSDSLHSTEAFKWAEGRLTNLYGPPLRVGCFASLRIPEQALAWPLSSGEAAVLIPPQTFSFPDSGFLATKLFLESGRPRPSDPHPVGDPEPCVESLRPPSERGA